MTIKVTIQNSDTRDSAIISVVHLDLTKSNDGTPISFLNAELNAGESREFWVHSTQKLLVSEVKQ